MDTFSAILGLGSLGAGIFGGIGQANTAAQMANAQFAKANQGILEGRQANAFGAAQSLWGPLFQAGAGGTIALDREKEAKQWLQGRYAERQMGLASEASKRARLADISPETKERLQNENRLLIERITAEKRALADAMFGSISSSYRA